MQSIGTYDHYFDLAERLQDLGVDFAIVVLHPGTSNIACVTNVDDVSLAEKMVQGLDKTFRDQFRKPETDTGDPADGI